MNIDIFNAELKKIDERLFVKSSVENYSEKDMVEYGIKDIEETRHYSLNVWEKKDLISSVVKERFDSNVLWSLNLTPTEVSRLMHLGFTRDKIWAIEKLLISQHK